MRKRDFLGGVLATAGAFIPQWAKAAFGIFQLNGPGGGGAGIPAGVAFQPIDGETVNTSGVQSHNYYANLSAGSGSNYALATGGLGGVAPGITFNGINYPLGWDDPAFFPIGVWLAPWGYSPSADVARWKSIGLNTSMGTNITVAGARAQFRNNGISSVDGYQYMGTSIAIDGAPGIEAVGINLYDEPQRLEQVEVSFIGNAAATFTASVTDNLMTVTVQSGGAALWSFDSSYDTATLTGTGLVGSGVSQQIDGYGTGNGGVGTYALRDYGTSSTSMTVGTGSQSLTLDAAVTGPFVGQTVHLIENIPAGTKAMTGTITVYTGGPGLTFNCTSFTGSGTQNAWIVYFQAPSETITQKTVAALPTSIQNNRFMVLNHPAAAWLVFPSLVGLSRTLSASSLYTQLYLAPDGVTQRHVDSLGTDYYAFPAAFSQGVGGGSQQLNNIYQNGYLPIMTPDQVAKGTHYGNFIDYMRLFQTTYKVPIGTFIDNSNSNSGIAYDTQAIETNWAVWSCIIHGGRQITYFNYVDMHSPSGCTGFFEGSDNFNCTVMQTPQTASVTSSIGTYTGSVATLTVSAVASGVVCPGMVSTAGVSGQIVVLQQTNNFSTPGKAATYLVAVISGAGTGSPTAFSQSNIGMGGVSNASNVFPAPFSLLGMRSTLTLTNTLLRTMAPVINSPFAVAASGTVGAGNGYIIGTSPTAAYIFPYLGVKSGVPPQSIDYGLAGSSGSLAASAIDCSTKYYNGSTYTATTGDSISAGFYIFATTRYPETKTPNFNVSFTINDPLATSITVIGESRNISIGSGIGTNSVTFTDHFDFAWTCRIYRVNH